MMSTTIQIRLGAQYILRRLNEEGYEAYIVGGCVRDSLLGRVPHDWDISTSATPDEMRRVFSDSIIYDTGAKHGTLTIISYDGNPYEVTTFRVDGHYSDNRRPDSVTFSRSMAEDMLRRDFTINALAYSEQFGLCDASSMGVDDLQNGTIRCVGDPDKRFNEDGLRIMRALRFSFEKSVTIEDLVAFERKHTRWAGGFPCCGRFVVRVLANSNVLTPEGVELRCQYMAATVEAAKKDLARWKIDDTLTEEERRQMT